jgi:lipopolysaccharide transport system ATP-binding protein
MYMRLAFAVAAHLDPEILIVDEVLTVGDAAFQSKCMGKMQDIGYNGKTVLFVSHNMAAIENLCEVAVLLEKGQIRYIGDTKGAIERYLTVSVGLNDGEMNLDAHPARRAYCLPLLKKIRLIGANNQPKSTFTSGEYVRFEITFDPITPLNDPQFGIGVDDSLGTRVFSLATYLSNTQLPPLTDRCIVACEVSDLFLAPGRYYLSLSAGTTNNNLIDALDNAVAFDVEAADYFGNGRVCTPNLGKVLMRSSWSAR